MKIEIVGSSETGLQRENNEDCIFTGWTDCSAIAIVADGMGGHLDGAQASRYICSYISAWWEDYIKKQQLGSFDICMVELEKIFHLANAKIRESHQPSAPLARKFVTRPLLPVKGKEAAEILSSRHRIEKPWPLLVGGNHLVAGVDDILLRLYVVFDICRIGVFDKFHLQAGQLLDSPVAANLPLDPADRVALAAAGRGRCRDRGHHHYTRTARGTAAGRGVASGRSRSRSRSRIRSLESVAVEPVALFVELPAAGHVLVRGLCEVILVNEIIASIVRRVDVYHLNFPEIGLPQEFEHLEIVSFDVEVPGAVEVHALGTAGAEGGCGRGVGVEYGVALVGPLKAVAFLVALDYFVRKFLPEQVEVDGGDDFAVFVLRLCEAVGEQSADFLYVFVYQVLGMHSEVFHICGVI